MTTNEYLSGSLLGETRGTLEEIFELYKQHASLVGFSVRKGKHRMKQGTSDVNEKYYLCSAAGIRNTVKKVGKETQSHDTEGTEKTKIRKERRVAITRTGCNACIRAKKNTFGLFEVIDHVLAHNHSMTRTQWNYRHRSERQMSDHKKEAIETMQLAGLQPMESYRLLSAEAGDGRSYLEEKYKLMVADINALLPKPVEVANAIDAETADVLPRPSVRDPNVLKTKGSSGKRINGAYDHYKRGSKNKKGKGKAHEEFGSKTPNVRLI
ncbi:unnamed protein product [Amaranthus hypochondriacus]